MQLFEGCAFPDQKNTLLNLKRAVTSNLAHRQPAKIVFTGFNKCYFTFISETWILINFFSFNIRHGAYKYATNACVDLVDLPFEVHAESVTELFPLEKLIYLSSDATSILPHIDEDKVYIIGALEDKRIRKHGASIMAARQANIPAFKLPIDIYLK